MTPLNDPELYPGDLNPDDEGIAFNGIEPTPWERDSLDYVMERLNAKTASLYRTSGGLRAFIVDQGEGEHLGVVIDSNGPPT